MRMIFRYLSTICVLLKYEILYIQLSFVFLPAGFAHGLPYAGYHVAYAAAPILDRIFSSKFTTTKMSLQNFQPI